MPITTSLFMFPPAPPWDGAHVLVVHFPIALLLVAPLFVLLAIFFPARHGFAVTAMLLLLLGTAGAFVAIVTGEAARDRVEDGPDAMFDLLDEHEEAAETTRNVYAVLAGLYTAYVIVSLLVGRLSRAMFRVPIGIAFLLCFAAAGLLLANTGHMGGRLVHEFGVRSAVAGQPGGG